MHNRYARPSRGNIFAGTPITLHQLEPEFIGVIKRMKSFRSGYVYVSAEEARAKADEARKMGDLAPDETSKAMLISIAQTWERIAGATSTKH